MLDGETGGARRGGSRAELDVESAMRECGVEPTAADPCSSSPVAVGSRREGKERRLAQR